MIPRALTIVACCVICWSIGEAQQQFRLALPGYHWEFPRDHFAHVEFANEWWYFTGNLNAGGGRRFGFELTFFRFSPRPGATINEDAFFAHFALTDIGGHSFFFHKRARRGEWGQAGVDAGSGTIWNENWRVEIGSNGPRALDAEWGREAVHLQLRPDEPLMLNGVRGWSAKGAGHGQASYYYSYPRLAATGEITSNGQREPVEGLVWMDHEFASNQLGADQQGWDWIGLQLNEVGGRALDLMAFNLRKTDGQRDNHSAGTLRVTDAAGHGATASLTAADFSMTPQSWWTSPHTGGRYPIAWTVEVPGRALRLQLKALLDDQELAHTSVGVDYWEGAVVVEGTIRGSPVRGRGYLEMTGYTRAFNALSAR